MVDEVEVVRCLLLLLLNIGSRLLFIIDGIVKLLNLGDLLKSESDFFIFIVVKHTEHC